MLALAIASSPGVAHALSSDAGTRDSDVTEARCLQVLPAAPPAVATAVAPALSYSISKPARSATLITTSPVTLTVPGAIAKGTIRFELPRSLPHHQAITYRIDVVTHAGLCTTGDSLALVLSDLSPTLALTLEHGIRAEYVRAAGQVFSYAASRAGELEYAFTDREIRDRCAAWFQPPTPCDWAPGERTSTIGTASAGGTILQAVPQPEGLGTLSARCRTVRLQNNTTDKDAGAWYWGGFSVTTPSPFAPFTIAQAQADKTNASQNRINLYSDVSRAVQGGANVFTLGNVGFHAQILAPTGTTLPIQPILRYSIRGQGSALAWRQPPTFPGDATGTTRMEAWAYSHNTTTGGAQTSGKNYDAQTSASDGVSGFGSANRSYDANRTVQAPVLNAGNNHVIRVYVRGRATALAQAAGSAAASATTDIAERAASRYLQANSVDLRLLSSEFAWSDTSRCVEWW